MTSKIYETAIEAVIKGDEALAAEVANKGLSEGIDPLDLLNQGFIPGINKIGDMFDTGAVFIPGLILASKAMQKATDIINAAMPESDRQDAIFQVRRRPAGNDGLGVVGIQQEGEAQGHRPDHEHRDAQGQP